MCIFVQDRTEICGILSNRYLRNNAPFFGGGTSLGIMWEKGHAPGRVAFVIAALVFAICAGAFVGFRNAVAGKQVLQGVRVAGINLGGLDATTATQLLRERLEGRLKVDVLLSWGQDQEFINLNDAGVTINCSDLVQQAIVYGRQGSLLRRLRERWQLLRRGYELPYKLTVSARFDTIVDSFRKKVEKPAVNARFSIEDNGDVSVIKGQEGLVIDAAALKEKILAVALTNERQVHVPLTKVLPEITAARARELEIKKVVSSFSTKFKASDANRTENIRVAAQALHGALIEPGATFSFNKRVGPRAASLGYKEAPVVVNGELVPDIGGGVCQVSSTLYNAALLAGLRIDRRVSHTIPSTYVELGRDATVAYDYIDFRFVNNTTGHIFIQAEVDGSELTIALLGKEQAPKARLVSKVESSTPAPVVQVVDNTLPPGKSLVEEKGGKGYVVSVWRVVGEAADEKWELIGKSTYKARPQVVKVGPKDGVTALGTASSSQIETASPNQSGTPSG